MADNLGNIGETFVQIKADMRDLDKEVKDLKTKMDKEAANISSSFGQKFKQGLKTVGGMVAGFFGLQAAVNFGNKIINTASEFEDLRTRLVNLYQDTDKATEVFNKFKDLAATTPYSLKKVVEAGSTLKAFGMNAENTLKSVTDLAAYMGLDVVEAANAVGRAFAGGAGAADILRERGVLNLIKDFKGIEDLTKLTLPEFREALLDAMVDPAAGIVGSTDRLSKNFSGLVSNMGDAWDNFMAALGGGQLAGMKNLVSQVTAFLEAITPTTTAMDEAKEKGFQLSYEFDNLTRTYIRLRENTDKTDEETKLYRDTINDLQSKYPNYLKNIDLHKDKLSDVKDAFIDARKELDNYITSLMKQAVIEQNKEQIGDLAKQLGEYTIILNGLKNAQEEVNNTGVDPFGKMSASQRGKLIEEGDLTTKFRTANIFTPLDDQVANVEKIISELEAKRGRLADTVKQMMDAFGQVNAPSNAPGGGGSGDPAIVGMIGKIEKKLEDLKKKKLKTNDLFELSQINKEMEDLEWLLEKFQNITPLEDGLKNGGILADHLIKKIETLNELSNKLGENSPYLTGELSDLDVLGAMIDETRAGREAFDTMFSVAMRGLDEFRIKASSTATSIERMFVDMGNIIIDQIKRILAEWAVLNIFAFATGGAGVSLSSLLFGGGKAQGGPVQPGVVYKVNENTPNSEYFMPTVPGTVIPNNMVESISNSNNAGVVSAINGLYGRMEAVTMQLIDMELSDRFKKIKIEGMETFVSNRGIHQTAKKGEKIYDRSR